MFDVFYFGDKPGLFAFEQPATSLEDAADKCKTTHYWYIYGGNDYTGFDFEYTPVPWETTHLHVWPSQHQRNGEVYLANKRTVHNQEWHFHTEQSVVRKPNRGVWTVPDNIDDTDFDYSWHPDRTEPDYEYRFPTQWQREGGPVYPGSAGVKYMTDQRIRAGATQIFYMDFLNGGIARHQFDLLKLTHPDIKRTRYVDNHLNVFNRIMNMATTEYVWIISSICDYTQFDFTWHPSEAQREMIHCFPSGNQRRGDTFYIHVPSFTQQMFELELLDWFNVINYSDDQQVERFNMPVQQYSTDDLVTEIKNYKFETPYVMFTNQKDLVLHDNPCLWTKKDRTVVRISTAGATAIVPRDIKEDLRTQIYDYPYIEDAKPRLNDYLGGRDCLDIVYISNGEPDEEKWYDHLCYQSNYHAKWVRGINGRTAAYQEAARQSATPWFFAVFAKLEVLGNAFPWHTWLPDYFQEPKHYIFNARNPVNGLEYGHQGVIAYNKRLVLENNTPGIDFTLSQPHESVPILSGTAHYNQSPWMTWRTAFREVVKLRHFMATAPTVETEHRLNVWLTVADGDFANWSICGAEDAVTYYDEVDGNYEKLKLSFDWQWLRERFNLSKPR
jgi:hypothetical protein